MTQMGSDTILSLTSAQLEFWKAAEEIDPPSTNSYAAEYVDIQGNINPQLFEKSLRQLIRDSETLRVIFIRDTNNEPKQILRENSNDWSLPYFDLSMEKNPEGVALEWMEEKFTSITDLSQWPLFTFALFKISDERFLWLQGYPHIIVDGFALMLLAKRTAKIYTSLSKGEIPEANRFLSLSKLVEEDEKYCSSDQFIVDQRYWGDLFSNMPSAKTLAGESLIESRGLLPDLRVIHYLTAEQTSKLYSSLKKESKSTLAQFITATMAAYIHLVTGVEDIVLSVVAMSRMESSERRVPGMSANMLPYRIKVEPEMSILDISKQAVDDIKQLKMHQRYRGGNLVNELTSLKNRQGVFGTEINVMCFKYNLMFDDSSSITHNVAAGTTDDLMINVSDRRDGQGIRVDIDASPEFYTQENIKSHLNEFISLLIFVSDNPQLSVSQLKTYKRPVMKGVSV